MAPRNCRTIKSVERYQPGSFIFAIEKPQRRGLKFRLAPRVTIFVLRPHILSELPSHPPHLFSATSHHEMCLKVRSRSRTQIVNSLPVWRFPIPFQLHGNMSSWGYQAIDDPYKVSACDSLSRKPVPPSTAVVIDTSGYHGPPILVCRG